MRKIVLLALFLVPLAMSLAARAQEPQEPEEPDAGADAAARLPDLRCFYVQGRCAPGGAAVGQASTSRNQIHNLLTASWDPSARILANAVWKHVAVTESWVATAKILPAAVHCDTYLAFVKGQAGVPQELWCIDGARLLLLWEMLDAVHGRYWTRPDGTLGIVLFDGGYMTGTYFLNTVNEQHFNCLGGAVEKTYLYPGIQDIETALGPYDITDSRARSSTLAQLRQLGIVPPPTQVRDDIALPPSWIQEDDQAGNLKGAQPASLFLLQGFWGGITCPAGHDPKACTATAQNRETVWLVRVGNQSSGYERWMNQRPGLGSWNTPFTTSIGTTASVVADGKKPLLPAVPCQK